MHRVAKHFKHSPAYVVHLSLWSTNAERGTVCKYKKKYKIERVGGEKKIMTHNLKITNQ